MIIYCETKINQAQNYLLRLVLGSLLYYKNDTSQGNNNGSNGTQTQVDPEPPSKPPEDDEKPVPPSITEQPTKTKSVLDGYLDEKESKQWLRNNGYQLSKSTDGGFILQYQDQRPGINIKKRKTLSGTIIGMPLKDGATLLYSNGKIRIKIK